MYERSIDYFVSIQDIERTISLEEQLQHLIARSWSIFMHDVLNVTGGIANPMCEQKSSTGWFLYTSL